MDSIRPLIEKTKMASYKAAELSTDKKNEILKDMADMLVKSSGIICKLNQRDIEQAEAMRLSAPMIDRLVLNCDRISHIADALRKIADLPDPVGRITDTTVRPNGISVSRMSIPLGVIAMIYESRPNVTADAAALCFKAGNSVVLRGGKEAFHSNTAIASILCDVLEAHGLPRAMITLIPTTDRVVMAELLTLDDLVDVLIPRGGEGLIKYVVQNSRIPVIKHYKGVCHLYVDKEADLNKAIHLLVDGKCSRPGVCNALETLLVHKDIAATFFPMVKEHVLSRNVEIHGCEKTCSYLSEATPATEEDYDKEYLDLVIASKVIDNFQEAIRHIQTYSSDHTEVIVTEDEARAERFILAINSAVVMVNASSRFSDGGELGLGAEIGISTTKLHAYGPMGIDSLTTKKFIVRGEGQTRENVELLKC